jgi:hypothetical protein
LISGDKSFLSGISVHLKSLLKEKEEQESELYKEWLSTEASNPDHINRAGTFRFFLFLIIPPTTKV